MRPVWSHQQIFDYVAMHLAKQGGRAMADNGTTCQYRAPDGRRCAVGCLLDPTVDTTMFEGSQYDPYNMEEHLFFISSEDSSDLLLELQESHDRGVWDDPWSIRNGVATRLANVARKYGLKDDVVTAAWPRD